MLSWYPIKCRANTTAAEVRVFVSKEYGKLTARNVFSYAKVPRLVPEKRTSFAHVVQTNRLRLSLERLLIKGCCTSLCFPQEEAQQSLGGPDKGWEEQNRHCMICAVVILSCRIPWHQRYRLGVLEGVHNPAKLSLLSSGRK